MTKSLVCEDQTIRQRICLVNTTTYGFFKYNQRMAKDNFKQRTFAETLTLLCKSKGGQFLRGGSVNGSHVARVAKTNQPNVSRWLNGVHDAENDSVELLAKAFEVTKSQMRGESPCVAIDGFEWSNDDLDDELAQITQGLSQWKKDILIGVARKLQDSEPEKEPEQP